jgi:hypothetical protein
MKACPNTPTRSLSDCLSSDLPQMVAQTQSCAPRAYPRFRVGFLMMPIVWFTNAYKKVGDEIRAGIIDTNEPDPTTANLLQEVELGVDKYQWQMRAHVQRTSTDPNTGWDLNDNKAVDLPSRTPPAQPEAD